jgi:hypothetical protein
MHLDLEGHMNLSASLRRGVVLAALLALAAPLAAAAGNSKGAHDRGNGRVFYATDTSNSLLQFSSDKPRRLRAKQITGLPAVSRLRASTSGRPPATSTRSAATRSSTG